MAKRSEHTFIQKISVSFLIVLFAFSITPVALLHNTVTRHKDVCYHNFQQKEKSVSKADINCRCLNFVADNNFITAFIPIQVNRPVPFFAARCQSYLLHFYSQHHFFAELRGPPASA